MTIEKQVFGQTPDGAIADIYRLTNVQGMSCAITNYGGIVVSLNAPDAQGRFDDVVLGHDRLDQYFNVNTSPYFGALIGRYGNRIAKGTFRLNDIDYTLALNAGVNHLHGGKTGFDKVLWKAKEQRSENGVGLELSYLSKDGEEGYPGNLHVTVMYTLTHENSLQIDYYAVSDRDTILNLTHHSYFNLTGAMSGQNILEHSVMLQADRFTPTDAELIPTGELRDVTGTPMDFRTETMIASGIYTKNEQLSIAGGYDHNWVLNGADGGLALAARVYEPTTGRVMEVYTTEPGIQLYTGNSLDGSIHGKGYVSYQRYSGFCLEAQHFPDSPNHPEFPSTILKTGEEYTQTTVYAFSCR